MKRIAIILSAIVFFFVGCGQSNTKTQATTTNKTIITEQGNERKIKYVWESNGGSGIFFNDGTAYICSRCDLSENWESYEANTTYEEFPSYLLPKGGVHWDFYDDDEKGRIASDWRVFKYHKVESDYDETLFPLIGNTIGFISFDWETFEKIKRIEFLNDDGSIWRSVKDYDAEDNKKNDDFRPWAYETGVFTVRCIAKSETDYSIIVNEEKNSVKRLKKHDSFKFEDLEEHVATSFVGTIFDINPIRNNPNDDAPIIQTTDEERGVTVSMELKGDWIKIKNLYTGKVLGWIRWKKDNRFMVWLVYSL